ncbi:hypothetical protein AVEN_24455-1 [Araneus ventricosus]|uniref:Uncharacterized protein n=1 Tax=Araneus ventricosus TaxID=182803 RepID=A0A4Y2IGB2_ARAVE|nr:hypothetical protein AVEN_24455-1 [Araneus ventricosus]
MLNRSFTSTQLQANGAVSHHTIPFRQVIHGRSTQCKSIHYGSLLSPTSIPIFKTQTPAAPISSRVKESHPPSPTYLHRSHFSIYSPIVQMEWLDIQTSNHIALIFMVFHIDDWFWRGAL